MSIRMSKTEQNKSWPKKRQLSLSFVSVKPFNIMQHIKISSSLIDKKIIQLKQQQQKRISNRYCILKKQTPEEIVEKQINQYKGILSSQNLQFVYSFFERRLLLNFLSEYALDLFRFERQKRQAIEISHIHKILQASLQNVNQQSWGFLHSQKSKQLHSEQIVIKTKKRKLSQNPNNGQQASIYKNKSEQSDKSQFKGVHLKFFRFDKHAKIQKYIILANILQVQHSLLTIESILTDYRQQSQKTLSKINNCTEEQLRGFYQKSLIQKSQQQESWRDIKKSLQLTLSSAINYYEEKYGKYASIYFLKAKIELQYERQIPPNKDEDMQVKIVEGICNSWRQNRQLYIEKHFEKQKLRHLKDMMIMLPVWEAQIEEVFYSHLAQLQQTNYQKLPSIESRQRYVKAITSWLQQNKKQHAQTLAKLAQQKKIELLRYFENIIDRNN